MNEAAAGYLLTTPDTIAVTSFRSWFGRRVAAKVTAARTAGLESELLTTPVEQHASTDASLTAAM